MTSMDVGTAWGYPYAEVFVDFNDLGRDPRELHACYPEHVRDRATLVPGQPVILTDCEGVEADGVVREIYNRGRGDLVAVTLVPDTFRDITTGWQGPPARLT